MFSLNQTDVVEALSIQLTTWELVTARVLKRQWDSGH